MLQCLGKSIMSGTFMYMLFGVAKSDAVAQEVLEKLGHNFKLLRRAVPVVPKANVK